MAAARTPVLLTIATVVGVLLLVRPGTRPTPSGVAAVRDVPEVSDAVVRDRRDAADDPPGIRPAGERSDPADAVLLPRTGTGEPTIGEFIYLFDVSGSTRGTDGPTGFAQGVDLLVPAVSSLRGLEEVLPARHRVATIGTTSLRQRPLCDITVERPTLFRATDTAAVTRAVRACDRALRGIPVEPYTDIRGALHFAALSIRGDRPALRGIVLVTDLVEDVAPGQTPATPDLDGVCVAVYSVVTTTGARDPDAVTLREREWERRMLQWNARRVWVRSALGFDSAELIRFFRGCEAR